MKTLAFGLVAGLIVVFSLVVAMSIFGRMSRKNELSQSISIATEQTVRMYAADPEFESLGEEEWIAGFTERLLSQMGSDTDLDIQVMGIDTENGLLSVRVTGTFTYPNGRTGSVTCEKTAVLERINYASGNSESASGSLAGNRPSIKEKKFRSVKVESEKELRKAVDNDEVKEIMLAGSIEVKEPIAVTGELTVVAENEACGAEIASVAEAGSKVHAVNALTEKQYPDTLFSVEGNGSLYIGENVCIHTNGGVGSAIRVSGNATVVCCGVVDGSVLEERPAKDKLFLSQNIIEEAQVTNEKLKGYLTEGQFADYGIYAEGKGTVVELRQGSSIRKNYIGVHSGDGELIINGGEISENGKGENRFSIMSENVSGHSGSGIEKTGGKLTISSGYIYNNGTLGGSGTEGSCGGGVQLTGSAVLVMEGGAIAHNYASLGGGVYVGKGCELRMTGGRIGGTGGHYGAPSLDENKIDDRQKGNYAREGKSSATKNKYAYGNGGGICSQGTVILNGTSDDRTIPIDIRYNVAKGAAGGGAVYAREGELQITGTTVLSYNRTWSSAADSESDLYAGGDANAEGGAIRIGSEVSDEVSKCFIGCNTDKKPLKSDVQVCGNSASGDGGAIMVSKGASNLCYIIGERDAENNVVKSKVQISENKNAENGGGAIKSTGGMLRIFGTCMQSNCADESGGAVSSTSSSAILGYNLFENNSAGSNGGAILNKGTMIVRSGCRILSNSSVGKGGGIYNMGELRLQTASVSGNEAAKGNALYLTADGRCELSGTPKTDGGSEVYLESGQRLYVVGTLGSDSGLLMSLKTQSQGDRNPGRILVSSELSGTCGTEILYDENGKVRFSVAFSKTDTGAVASVRAVPDGLKENIAKKYGLNESTIYLSEQYTVSYDQNLKQMEGNPKSEEVVVQKPYKKYWYEDISLNLDPPSLKTDILKTRNIFVCWESEETGDKITSKSYTANKDLILLAKWKINELPILRLKERWFTLAAIRKGLLTADILLKGIRSMDVTDPEDGNLGEGEPLVKNEVLYSSNGKITVYFKMQPMDRITDLDNAQVVRIPIYARDSLGAESGSEIWVNIVKSEKEVPASETTVRFISQSYMDKPFGEGGFSVLSFWKEKNGRQLLVSAFERNQDNRPLFCFHIPYGKAEAARSYIYVNRASCYREESLLKSFFDEFLSV